MSHSVKMLCLLVLAAGVVLPGTRVLASPFTLVCRSDTLQQVEPGNLAEFHFTLTNTGTQPDVYRLDYRVLDSVPGWVVVCCVRGRCAEPGVPFYDSLAPGEADSTPDLTVYTTATHGEEVVSLKVTSLSEPQLVDSIGTRTRVGAGIAEPGSHSRSVRVQSLAHVVRNLLFLDPGFSPAVLLDACGRKVSDLTCGPNRVARLASGLYYVRPVRGGPGAKIVVE
jgi:hypothetical protein